MDVHTKAQRSYNMSRVRSKNTLPELRMFSLLKEAKIRFRKHYSITGNPDIAFPKLKVVIFIDGEFWHGKGFKKIKHSLSPFWQEKIGRNIKRDKLVRRNLAQEGWKVVKFWDKDVIKHPKKCLKKVQAYLKGQ